MLRIKSAAPQLPVSVGDMRGVGGFGSVWHFDDDALIGGLIAAAVEQIERASGVGYSGSIWEWTASGFPPGCIDLGMEPVASAVISYTDQDGISQSIAQGFGFIVSGSQLVVDGQWPASMEGSTVSVSFVSGAGACPEPVKLAIKQMVMSAYSDRVGGGELTGAAQRMAGQFRKVWF